MSVSQSMVFDLLQRFPSETYQITYRDVSPNEAPGPGEIFGYGQQISFNVRGAPNEFIMTDASALRAAVASSSVFATTLLFDEAQKFSQDADALRPGLCWIGGIEETLNSGSLQTYQNNNVQDCNIFNCLRAMATRRPAYEDKWNTAVEAGLVEDMYPINGDAVGIQALQKCGFASRRQRAYGFYVANEENQAASRFLGGYDYSVPLTAVSSVAQSTAMIPVGLFSSYASGAWQLKFKVSTAAETIDAGSLTAVRGPLAVSKPTITLKVLKILDETLMEAILSLYSKTNKIETPMGSIPLGLNLNTFQYDFHTFSIPVNTNNALISIPATHASVRGIIFRFVMDGVIPNVLSAIPGYPFVEPRISRQEVILDTFQVKIGSTCIQETPIQNHDTPALYYQGNRAWWNHQMKKAGHLFSLLYNSREKLQHFDGPEDLTFGIHNPLAESKPSMMSAYALSFENMNQNENENSGSGINLRNTGRIDLHLKLAMNEVVGTRAQAGKLTPATTQNIKMYVIVCSDRVLEVSRSGCRDITNATL